MNMKKQMEEHSCRDMKKQSEKTTWEKKASDQPLVLAICAHNW